MDLETTDFDSVMSDILAAGKPPTDSASWKAHADALREELRDAMLEGDAGAVIRIQSALQTVPMRIRALEIAECRAGLADVQKELAQVAALEIELQEARKIPGARIEELMKELEQVGNEFERYNFSLGSCAMDRQGLHERRREINLRLKELEGEINREIEAEEIDREVETNEIWWIKDE